MDRRNDQHPRPEGLRVLVMARSPAAGLAHPLLEPVLGLDRCIQLEQVLVDRAIAWGETVAPGNVHADHWPGANADAAASNLAGDAEATASNLAGEVESELTSDQPPATLVRAHGEGARMAAAASRLFAAGDGPLLIVWPDLPSWRADHAWAALDDFANGCDASFGPVFDGGFYLVALARELPHLLAAADDAWRGPEAMTTALGASHLGGLRAGLLRPERGLRRPGDLDAALADPLLDDELAALLRS